jgi:hypothetical protein
MILQQKVDLLFQQAYTSRLIHQEWGRIEKQYVYLLLSKGFKHF